MFHSEDHIDQGLSTNSGIATNEYTEWGSTTDLYSLFTIPKDSIG